MNTLKDQMIIYDDSCPMCTAYTGAFTQLGWLSERIPFSTVSKDLLGKIDVDRGRHEIPLYNPLNETVIYGLDALFLIIGSRFPWLKPLLKNRVFRLFWKQIYWIITYNRRIIAGSRAPRTGLDCAPDRHLGYRWLYIGILLMISFFLFLNYYNSYPTIGLFTLPAAFFLISGLILHKDRLTWLGHWITIIFIQVLFMCFLPVTTFTLAGLAVISSILFWRRWLVI